MSQQINRPQKRPKGLPIAFANVKAGNTSENKLNDIRQIIFLYRAIFHIK